MFSVCNPGRASGRGLLALVVAACSSIGMSLPVALVRIIRQFEGTACTSLGTLGSGASILWLMGLILIMNSLSTTQGEQRITDLRFGSFQAFADAVQWGIITVQRFSRREINLQSKLRFRLIEGAIGRRWWQQKSWTREATGRSSSCFVFVVCNTMMKRIVEFWLAG